MENKWKNTNYTELVRIKKEDKQWLKENKGKLSMAGYLHKIINNYKSYGTKI